MILSKSLKGRLKVSDLTAKQILFCENYILTRDIKQSSLIAGYSESYSKSKAYELLQDEKIQQKIQELEKTYNQEHFKRLSTIANKELETILLSSENDNTRLRAIELIYKLSGIIKDDKISLNINNENKVSMDNIKSFNDFYEN
jgi:phage terminase small subunit